jgi:hypothetical protein
VSWSSKKQTTLAAYTTDTEYQACGAAAQEGMSLRKALREMALPLSGSLLGGPVIIRCEQGSIVFVQGPQRGAAG